jgi:hypothetical protein
MRARRNPSRAATNLKSEASVRVQRQCPVLAQAACSRDAPARVLVQATRKRRSPSRIADLRIQSARRVQAASLKLNASYRLCAQIKDERSVRWCNRLERNHLASFAVSRKIRVSPSVGSRDTLVAMRRHRDSDFSSHGKAIRLAECGRGLAQRFQRLTPSQSGVTGVRSESWGSVINTKSIWQMLGRRTSQLLVL